MRVIAGRLKGRTFAAPQGLSTRPTTDKVREALFAVLGDVANLHVLDLYAGTGSLGIEALSRGAAHCTFVERAKAAVKVLRDNLARLGLQEQSKVLATSIERCHALLLQYAPFDLVLCDPPWTDIQAAERILGERLRPELYADDATIVIGHPKTYELKMPSATRLQLEEIRNWGDAGLSIFHSEA